MLEAFYQKAGRADVAGIARKSGLYMIDGLRSRANPATDGMASCAILWRILEYALYVALLTLQGGMHVPEDESGFCVVERCGFLLGFRQHRGNEICHQQQHRRCPRRKGYSSST